MKIKLNGVRLVLTRRLLKLWFMDKNVAQLKNIYRKYAAWIMMLRWTGGSAQKHR